MKRAKIMLMTIAVLATVGTALAFKVAKKGNTTYCYEKTSVEPAHCTLEKTQAVSNGGIQVYYYTTKTADCSTLSCSKTANNFGI